MPQTKLPESVRNLAFTYFGFTEHTIQHLRDWKPVKYACITREPCPDTGRMHYQGYIEFSSSVRSQRIQVMMPGCHIEERKGTLEQNRVYCSKGLQNWEWGEPHAQGKRSDLQELTERVKGGATLFDIAEEYPSQYIRYYRGIAALIEVLRPVDYTAQHSLASCASHINHPVLQDIHTVLLVGESQVGKTQFALAHFKQPLLVRRMDRLKSFVPGFHDGIVFDDISHFGSFDNQRSVVEWDTPTDMACRHQDAFIPAHTPKIICSNPERIPLDIDSMPIKSRLTIHYL